MFRRRRLIRRRPPFGRASGAAALVVPPAAAEAERLFRAGRNDQAASRFDDLAREAEEQDQPEAAGNLYLRAARCYVELDDLDKADQRAEQAIHLFIEARRLTRVRQVLPRVLVAMERHGRKEDAERLRRDMEEAFRGMEPLPGQMGRRGRMAARLPAKCSSCGGPIKPDEVSWSGPATAECPYCGAVVKAE